MESWNHLSVLLSKDQTPKRGGQSKSNTHRNTSHNDGLNRIVDVSRIKARPIPDLKLLSSLTEASPEDKTVFNGSIDKFVSKKTHNSLLLGTTLGWLAGVGVTKVGKIVAFGLGGGIMLLHFACDLGYIEINWDKVREGVHESHKWIDKVVRFVRDNSSFAMGFIGGFFFVFAAS